MNSAEGAGELAAVFAGTTFRWPLRRYQQLAVDAFERVRSSGRRRAYLVMPPGSGKTALGLEIARRIGNPALVLCPNTAVQAQWLEQWRDFQPPLVEAGADPDLASPLTVLTYQAICNFEVDDAELDDQAISLWRDTLRAEQELAADQAEAEIQRLRDEGSPHFKAELLRFRQKARALVARGGQRQQLLALLHPNGRQLIARMKESGTWTLVLDECHHLLEMWGYLVKALVDELGDAAFVVGLTATPPDDMDAREAALQEELFGQADFEVRTPAVVKEGDLAPYQELAFLTTPLDHELAYISAQHQRFQELLVRLLDADFATTPFIEWMRKRIEIRGTAQGSQISWGRFERDHPELALAAVRFLHEQRLPLPTGARLGEAQRRPPTADDWVVLIEDYCRGHLQHSADPRDLAAWQEIRRALLSLGYVLTRQGVRRYVSPVDRVLSLSASKAAAALMILGEERLALGARLRALILCDYERAGPTVLAKLQGVLDPQAGSAALLLHILLSDSRIAELDPILVTGRTVACSRASAVALTAWIESQVPELHGAVSVERLFVETATASTLSWEDVVIVRPFHPWWQPRHYVPLVTRYFEDGRSQCLVGTRALLGEGWDAKTVNVMIDLTAATTSTAVHQMRGRSLRLDPALPRKVANNWDVVCVASEHPKGTADYGRFVRKHRRYYAPTATGEIESGVSHVHPSLSPFGPPGTAEFEQVNAAMLRRAGDREAAHDRWAVGQPYENTESHTVRIRFARPIGVPGRRLFRYSPDGQVRGLPGWRAAGTLGVSVGVGLVGMAMGGELAGLVVGLGLLAAGSTWLGKPMADAVRRLGPSDALEDLACAVVEALSETGGVARALGAHSVRIAAQEDGYCRCYLAGASAADSRLFSESLDELMTPLGTPRYIIPRYVVDPPRSFVEAVAVLLRQAMARGYGARVVYHAVPDFLAANRNRAEAFGRAWNRYVSAGVPLYCQSPRAQAIVETQRGQNPFEITTQMRTLWR